MTTWMAHYPTLGTHKSALIIQHVRKSREPVNTKITVPLLLNLFCKEVDLFKAAPCFPTVDWAVVVNQPLLSLLLGGELVRALAGYTRERREESVGEEGGDGRQ